MRAGPGVSEMRRPRRAARRAGNQSARSTRTTSAPKAAGAVGDHAPGSGTTASDRRWPSARSRAARSGADWTATATRITPPLSRLVPAGARRAPASSRHARDRKSTRLNSSHVKISYAVFCLKKKKQKKNHLLLLKKKKKKK